MKIFTIGNSKGGVGKSTIACNYAVMAAAEGARVLLVDSDVQASSMAFRALREKDDIQAMAITTPTLHKDLVKLEGIDIIVVDAGGRESTVFRSAILAADILIIPVLPSAYDVWATEDTITVLKEAQVYKAIPAYIAINQIIPNTVVSREAREAIEELARQNDINIVNAGLCSRVAYKNSIAKGQAVVEYEPNGKAAEEIRQLFAEVQKI